jgi:acyl-CoA dehydrogenase
MSGALASLAGGVFAEAADNDDDNAELVALVEGIGSRSFSARVGHRSLPEEFDRELWRNLEDTGLSRLTSTADLGAGPAELAIVLRGLARYAGAVPVAETDLLAAWLGARAGLELPAQGPLTVAIAQAEKAGGRIVGTAHDVPWTRVASANGGLLLAARTADGLDVGVLDDPNVTDRQNLAGEPRDSVAFDLPAAALQTLDTSVGDELIRRGAWARCVQIIGALDTAAALSVAHAGERVQFGRTLSKFQSVQHSLATMAGEIERARAAATLAVAAAADHGFAGPAADYAVTVAKVVVGQTVSAVTRIAHQLHGAIGVTIEHQLWLSTMRARSWTDEFGSTGHYARRLGRIALNADDPWDVLIGNDLRGWG